MANFRKSFNFRNGVQVDTDNFVVTPLGLVGIGTTVPTEFLDVRGTATVTGLVTSTDLYVSGISTLNQVTISGETVTAGVVTASYLYGDGSGLTNIPTSQWVDSDVGLGYTSIYSQGNVGVATTSPYHTLQVGSDPTVSGQYGVGISSSGNIYSSGIVTAVSFIGSGSQLTGIGLTVDVRTNSFVVSGVSTIAVTSATDLTTQQLSVSGLSTFTGNIDANANLDVDGHTELDDVNISGIVTAFDLDVDGHAELDQVNVSGVSTFVGNVTASGDLSLVGNLDVDGATTLDSVTISETLGVTQTATFTGNIDANGDLDVDGHAELDQVNVSGVSTFVGNVTIGTGNSSAVLRFGDTIKTFDIINNETGNINMYLHNGDVGVGTGRFDWIYGQTNQELMSLNYDGKLGLGKTNPDNTLHVVGTSTVTGNAWFGGDVTISGTISADTFALPTVVEVDLNSTGISTFNIVSVGGTITSANIGISTDVVAEGISLDVQQGSALFASVGINTTVIGESLNVDGFASFTGVGIGTTVSYIEDGGSVGQVQLHGNSFRAYNSNVIIKSDSAVGFNTNTPRSVLDYGLVEGSISDPYVILPNVSTSTRAGLAQTAEGSIIYNSTSKKHQGYGSTDGGTTFDWHDLY